ncbi:MAG: CDP-diacylglycerol--glycerol-3-phosphate 3-phosphatidyltransferase [Mollicutes bacterium]|jgi:CDP-diacylglycerol--glycerol-3-phosphate 3-phosphatidyltransferase|nr:CDP-diacylglycerol--glycerol-3-phosphate 3-phosphatidyltransferase [Mollicutes bacterium]
MNLPNKITTIRIFLSVFLIVFLLFPFYQVGMKLPVYSINGNIELSFQYIIGGLIFAVASATDFLDGYLARKNGLVTDFGKVMDAIADKILVNGILIILAYNRDISIIVPVIIITRDTIVDSIKMIASKKSGAAVPASIAGKIKTIFMMVGVTFVFFNNLPFMLINFEIGKFMVLIATVLSVYSGLEYFIHHKDSFMKDK